MFREKFMRTKTILFAGLAVAIACAIAVRVFVQHQAAREVALAAAKAKSDSARVRNDSNARSTPMAPPTAIEQAPFPEVVPVSDSIRQPQLVSAGVSPNGKTPKVAQTNQPSGSAKDPVTDPVARIALSLVGVDPEAELYWVAAINDPSLPDGERQDLIEDLNEEGLPDPKHPTIDDLPLILSRLDRIERLMPWAMDKVN